MTALTKQQRQQTPTNTSKLQNENPKRLQLPADAEAFFDSDPEAASDSEFGVGVVILYDLIDHLLSLSCDVSSAELHSVHHGSPSTFELWLKAAQPDCAAQAS